MSDLPPAAPVPAAQPAAPTEKWNVLSIVGFVLSLLGFNVIAIVLGFIGLNQVKKTGERGHGLALAAVIIGFVSIAIIIILIVVSISLVAAAGSISTTSY